MMAGPAPRPHRGHTSPPEVPALPHAGGGEAMAPTSPGVLGIAARSRTGLCRARWARRGRALRREHPQRGGPGARGVQRQLRASIACVLIQLRRHFHGSVCETGHPWEEKSVQGAWDVAAQPLPRRTIMQMGSLVRAEPF